VDQDLTSLIFEGLTTTNNYGEIVPDLAESWSVSADGLEYIFTLRDDALWQDGVPFTAEDVALTFDLVGDPEFPGAAALRDFWKTVEVGPLGERMVRFRLTQPLASFPDYLRRDRALTSSGARQSAACGGTPSTSRLSGPNLTRSKR
jgi:peptide/nickel transport system substrate-binding protein